jgi:hypothetical protein
MMSDSAYYAQCVPAALLLLEASGGNPSVIPPAYLDFFEHTFTDGDVSLVSKISTFSDFELLEHEQFIEILEDIAKVNPEEIPYPDSIQRIDCSIYFDESPSDCFDFAEDNLGLSEKVEKCVESCIGSVFGGQVQNIRDRKGRYAGIENNFLREEDGTFSGTFSHEGLTFLFELAPTESGWLCTYRLREKTLDKYPSAPKIEKDREKKVEEARRIRSLGWSS